MSAQGAPADDPSFEQDEWLSWLHHDCDVRDNDVEFAGANVGSMGDTGNEKGSSIKDGSLKGTRPFYSETSDPANCMAFEDLLCNDALSEETPWLSSKEYYGVPSDSSVGSVDSFASAPRLRRRRRQARQHTSKARENDARKRRYQCTFCTDAFKTKHDWQRHETTMHLSLEQWKCARYGPTVYKSNGEVSCVFCNHSNPSVGHAEFHNYSACAAQSDEARLFHRKDHLRQHLRLFHHGCNFNESMASWVSSIDDVRSRCGFCDAQLNTWTERQRHLAVHFRAGTDMTEWEGDRGFDQKIEQLVENDMPAFLIGNQRRTMEPFSASRADHRVDTCAVSSFSTNETSPMHEVAHSGHSHQEAQRLLLRFVSNEILNSHVPSDTQIQRKMSEIIYGPGNTWDSTWADNPQWLDMFRKKAGLISLPLSGGKNAFIGF